MKYRLKSDPSVLCEVSVSQAAAAILPDPSDYWVNVIVVRGKNTPQRFTMPRWLFEKQWDPVPDRDAPGLHCIGCGRKWDDPVLGPTLVSYDDPRYCAECRAFVPLKMKVVKPRCEACWFWEEAKGTTPPKGLCHSNCPMPRTDGQLCGFTSRPITFGDDWCRDFKAKE